MSPEYRFVKGPCKEVEHEACLSGKLLKEGHTCKWHLSWSTIAQGHRTPPHFPKLLGSTVNINPDFCTLHPAVSHIVFSIPGFQSSTTHHTILWNPVSDVRLFKGKQWLPYLRPGVLNGYWKLTTSGRYSSNIHSMWTSTFGWRSQDPLWKRLPIVQGMFAMRAPQWRISHLPSLE